MVASFTRKLVPLPQELELFSLLAKQVELQVIYHSFE